MLKYYFFSWGWLVEFYLAQTVLRLYGDFSSFTEGGRPCITLGKRGHLSRTADVPWASWIAASYEISKVPGGIRTHSDEGLVKVFIQHSNNQIKALRSIVKPVHIAPIRPVFVNNLTTLIYDLICLTISNIQTTYLLSRKQYSK